MCCWLLVSSVPIRTPRFFLQSCSAAGQPSMCWCLRLFFPRCRNNLHSPLLSSVRSSAQFCSMPHCLCLAATAAAWGWALPTSHFIDVKLCWPGYTISDACTLHFTAVKIETGKGCNLPEIKQQKEAELQRDRKSLAHKTWNTQSLIYHCFNPPQAAGTCLITASCWWK